MGGQASQPVKEEKVVSAGEEDSGCSEQQFDNHSKINFVPSESPPPHGEAGSGSPPDNEVEVGEEEAAKLVVVNRARLVHVKQAKEVAPL